VDECLGIYLHIPFCQSKCYYCDFASGAFPVSLVDPYVQALRREIEGYGEILEAIQAEVSRLPSWKVDSLYLGGGTPSSIETRYIVELIRFLATVFEFSPDIEITLEVNPGNVNREKALWYKKAGINRISIGLQAFQDHLLKEIGRTHNVEEALMTFKLLREAGFNNLSLDLIAGLPGQTVKDWQENLTMLHLLNPEHISIYLLELHENTPLGRIYKTINDADNDAGDLQGSADLPSEDAVEYFYLEAVRELTSKGYGHYEISNFAKPGWDSRHNLKYWTDQPFLGFGCSAFSYLDGKRWGNERNPWKYIERIDREGQAVDCLFQLAQSELQEESIFLGLRLMRGLNLRQFRTRFGLDFYDRYGRPLNVLEHGGFVECGPDWVRLTPKGCLLSNEVFTELLK
jgi:putative oxygen-independent coproporphyrinogen III oxidase